MAVLTDEQREEGIVMADPLGRPASKGTAEPAGLAGERASEDRAIEGGAPSPPVFLLLHGTWARNAPWVGPGSVLVKTLSSEFPGATIVPIAWSGANTFTARSSAADSLIETIMADRARRSRPTVLIGHSHGGSAIVYALRRSEMLRSTISGAVLLGTPFYALAPRAGHQSMFRAVSVLALVFLSLIVSFLAGYAANPQEWSQSTQDIGLLAGAAIVFVAVLAIGRHVLSRTAWLDSLVERISRSVRHWNTVDCPPVPLLFVRTTGDEVALALAGLQLLAYASNTVSRGFAAAMGSLSLMTAAAWRALWSRVLLVVLGSAMVSSVFMCGVLMGIYEFPISAVLQVANPLGAGWRLWVSGTPVPDASLTTVFRMAVAVDLVALAAVCIVGSALLFGLVVAGLLSTTTLLAFGAFSPKQALALEMAAEPIPYGAHELVHISWESDAAVRRATGFTLRHSAPYQDPQGIHEVVRWIQGQLSRSHEASTSGHSYVWPDT